ncbi:MAG: GreA/GreB family elongation factor [Flavobacteriales bacterium]
MTDNFEKRVLVTGLLNTLNDRINLLKADIAGNVQEAADNNKGSAGDKHEVGFEMQSMEIEKLSLRLIELEKMVFDLSNVQLTESSQVDTGSLVQTNHGHYFISIAFGQMKHRDQWVYIISPQSPLAQALMNKEVGQTVTFNGLDHRILSLV